MFLLPLVALVVLRFLDGGLDAPRPRRSGSAPLLALADPASRPRSPSRSRSRSPWRSSSASRSCPSARRAVVALAPAAGRRPTCVAAALTAPFLYYAALRLASGAPSTRPDSLDRGPRATSSIPTKITAIGGAAASRRSRTGFTGNLERAGRVPRAADARDRRASSPATLAHARSGASCSAALVAHDRRRARRDARRWQGARRSSPALVARCRTMPVFDNVLTARFAVYACACSARSMVALWTARRRPGTLRWLLPVLAVLAIVPDPHAAAASRPPTTCRRSSRAACTGRASTPDRRSSAVSDPRRRTRCCGRSRAVSASRWPAGDIGPVIPESFFQPPDVIRDRAGGSPLGVDQAGILRTFLSAQARDERRRRRRSGERCGPAPRPDRRACMSSAASTSTT